MNDTDFYQLIKDLERLDSEFLQLAYDLWKEKGFNLNSSYMTLNSFLSLRARWTEEMRLTQHAIDNIVRIGHEIGVTFDLLPDRIDAMDEKSHLQAYTYRSMCETHLRYATERLREVKSSAHCIDYPNYNYEKDEWEVKKYKHALANLRRVEHYTDYNRHVELHTDTRERYTQCCHEIAVQAWYAFTCEETY